MQIMSANSKTLLESLIPIVDNEQSVYSVTLLESLIDFRLFYFSRYFLALNSFEIHFKLWMIFWLKFLAFQYTFEKKETRGWNHFQG